MARRRDFEPDAADGRHAIPFRNRDEAERAVAFVASCGVDTRPLRIRTLVSTRRDRLLAMIGRRRVAHAAWIVVDADMAEPALELLRPFGAGGAPAGPRIPRSVASG